MMILILVFIEYTTADKNLILLDNILWEISEF